MAKKFFFILLSLILAVGFSYCLINFNQIKEALAGSEHNVSGWAWSENIGWISFNSTNQGGGVDYGVNVDQNGFISGYAWSENIGWISFNQSQLSGCPSAPCQARFNQSTGQVSGWARACAGTINGDCSGSSRTDGWDGWIHLRGSNYGVSVSGCNWDGFAWGGEVVGWIHFKGPNYGVVGSGNACRTQPPSATNLSVNQPDYCHSGPGAIFSWRFTDPEGDSQSAYQVQVDNNPDFSSPEDDSGKVNSSSQSYATPPGKLSYNTTYYWRLMVWDSTGVSSNWISGPQFTTPLHAYPSIDFSWFPSNPSIEEVVQFIDQSTVYGRATKSSWAWTFQDGDPSSSNQQNPQVKFVSEGSKQITLTVADSDGFSCTGTGSKTFNVSLPLPQWKEIPPIFWLRKLFANLLVLAKF